MNMRSYILMLTVLFAVRVSADEQAAVRGFLKAHCYDCHSGDSVEAGLNLEQLKFDLDDSNVDQWIHIVDRVSAG
ncbi:MAG: c-type cytochrome domain-containing protein, partial [Fuerstiella sp.]